MSCHCKVLDFSAHALFNTYEILGQMQQELSFKK